MGRPKQQFSLYKRDNGIWYYMTYDAFGKRTTKKSTGQTNKTAAHNYCLSLFKDNLLIPDSSVKISTYMEKKNFYVWGKCSYSVENELTQSYTNQCLARFQNHILPYLANMTFDDLTSKTINQWQSKLLTDKDLAPKTVRDTRSVLFTILDSARVDGYLTKDIKLGIKKLPKNKRKVRGILTEHEVSKLFDKANYHEYWGDNFLYYTASLVACFTGMRQGEILALTPDKIFENHIYVCHSYNKFGLGPTKTKETRQVYMNNIVKHQLIEIMPESGFIFTYNGDSPLTPQRLTEAFYRAIEKMGISKVLREQRNITFHSFRHFLVTYLRGKGVTDAEITSITGQKTIKIIDDYTRFDKLSNHNVIAALEEI
ncbi:MAG: tyrosine-type recombinase/integrase [Spirochaetaceae bacterium]